LLYPENMKEVSIIVHDDYVEDLVRSLHESGLIETMDVGKSGKDFVSLLSQPRTSKITSECADLEMQLNKIIEVLDRAKDEAPGNMKETIRGFLSPPLPLKYKVRPTNIFQAKDSASQMIFELEPKITQIERKLEEISEETIQLSEHKKQIENLATFDFKLKYLGESEYLIIKAGTTTDENRLRLVLSKVPDSLVFTSQIEKKLYSAVVVAHKDDKEPLENALKGVFSAYSLPHYKGTPSEALEQIEHRIKAINNQKKVLWNDLKNLRAEKLKDLLIIREEISIFKARGETLSKFGKTDSTSIVMGWAPKRNIDDLEELVEQETGGLAYIHLSDPENPEDIPIYRRNPRWAKPFEMLTEMFALPYYHEVDPTIILAPIFVIFFGLGWLCYFNYYAITLFQLLCGHFASIDDFSLSSF